MYPVSMMRRFGRAWMLMLAACAPATQSPDATSRDTASAPSPSPSDRSASPPIPEPSPPPDPERPCEALTRTACMQSTTCTLEHVAPRSKQYRCRPATAPCEEGLAQAGFWGSGTDGVARSREQQAECAARPGCGFVDGGCYCHCRGMGQTAVPDGDEAEPCDCECAGGPPPTCAASP